MDGQVGGNFGQQRAGRLPGRPVPANTAPMLSLINPDDPPAQQAAPLLTRYDKDKNASVEVPDSKAKEGKRKVAVNIGISNGAKTELLKGLKEGDQVVLQ